LAFIVFFFKTIPHVINEKIGILGFNFQWHADNINILRFL